MVVLQVSFQRKNILWTLSKSGQFVAPFACQVIGFVVNTMFTLGGQTSSAVYKTVHLVRNCNGGVAVVVVVAVVQIGQRGLGKGKERPREKKPFSSLVSSLPRERPKR